MAVDVDVLVIGSGSAAMSAALRALVGGLKVTVIEKSNYLGGTSAMSGAGIWVPANHLARAQGIPDSREEALEYVRAASPPTWHEEEDHLWRAFIEHAPEALEFIEEHSPLELELVSEPDVMAELPGGKVKGRMVSTKPLSRKLLGKFARKLRPSTLPNWFTYQEQLTYDAWHHPLRIVLNIWPRLLYRFLTGSRAMGAALMTALIRGCQDRDCEFLLNARARKLVCDQSGRVTGALVEVGGETREINARRGVVIASGGFEWDPELRERHFPGPIDRLGSPWSNEGDGQKMAAEVGAKLDRMDQANIFPCVPTRYEGKPLGLPKTFQAERHSVVIDGTGRRFVSETNFNIGEVMDARDPMTGQPLHQPIWLIGDARYYRASPLFAWYSRYEKDWVKSANTISDLARKIGIPADSLSATIDRFNSMSNKGRDDDFHRGQIAFENYKARGAKNPLGRIERAPFYAVSFNRSILGTKGGARTNERGQVLRPDGSIIAGLYAAGLSMANPIGTRAIGAGTTIGPNLTWGYICAEAILKQNRT
ncbi:FAD-dependent oxidoreductase [Bradyrhizobium zhanjiangense]|uniref:FAD-dependent oxidoreductase n=1 Tax=Bradyrhizobium zhanjiangense TaxID=1325107 RepID=UPI001008AC71|nr:FAD-dependent oxidoreductase [Bradyrhizobium zhanjiangense]